MTHLSQMFTLNYFRNASNELKPEFQRNDLNPTSPETLFKFLSKSCSLSLEWRRLMMA